MEATKEINRLQVDLLQLYKAGYFDVDKYYFEKIGDERRQPRKTWSFWNAMFYCGTIYTTIGKSVIISIVFFFFFISREIEEKKTLFTNSKITNSHCLRFEE